METVLRINPLNYFILEPSKFLLRMVEKLDVLRPSYRQKVMQLVEYALIDLNYVPFKEIACLCIHFNDTSASPVTAMIAQALSRFLGLSKRLGSIYRDVGLVTILGNMTFDMATNLRRLLGSFLSESSLASADASSLSLVEVGSEDGQPSAVQLVGSADELRSSRRKPYTRFPPTILENYNAMMALAMQLLEGDVESCGVWIRCAKGALLDLVAVDELRPSALKVMRTIGLALASRDKAAVGNEFDKIFVAVIETILSAPARSVAFKADVFEVIGELMSFAPVFKSSFREAGGYMTAVSILASLEDVFLRSPPFPLDSDLVVPHGHLAAVASVGTEQERESIIRSYNLAEDLAPSSALAVDYPACARLVNASLLVLMEASKNDETGRALLAAELDSLMQAIRLSGILQTRWAAHLLGTLFSLALEDGSLQQVFVGNTWEAPLESTWASPSDDPTQRSGSSSSLGSAMKEESAATQQVTALRNTMARSTRLLRNPSTLVALLALLPDLGGAAPPKLGYACLIAIHGLSLGNRGNHARMSGAAMLMRLLVDLYAAEGWLAPHNAHAQPLRTQCRETARLLAMRLLELGVASDTELRFLFEQANPDAPWNREDPAILNDVAEVILHGIKYGRTPAHVHFDHRTSSLSGVMMENQSVNSSFPPNGWSYSIWLRVQDFDPLGNVNLLTLQADDSSDLPILGLSIEGQSRKVVVTAGKSHMRFENFALRPRKWYHMVIVHARSRMTQLTSSSITLFIDGIVAEQAKCGYPSGSSKIKRSVFGVATEEAATGPSQLVWDLGTCHFFGDVLDSDSVNIVYNLGPQYRGNFQDALKKYQTYEIIDSVNLDFVNSGNEDGTDLGHLALSNAVVRCGGVAVTEDQILFSLSANIEIADASVKSRAQLPDQNLLVNSAKPRDLHLADWISAPSMPGAAKLLGNALRINPHRLVDGIWKVGGCALLVKFVEGMQSPELLFKAVCILVESVRFNWRNTEDMEREHLYEAFASVLRNQIELVTAEVVDQLLVLVGKLPNLPTEAVLANTMAYRFLFLDFELWRKASRDIQKLILNQFQDFTVGSRKRVFNARRLGKLFLTKRLLMALRTEVFTQSLLRDVVHVIKSSLIASFNVDSVRAIATFIMSTLPQNSASDAAAAPPPDEWGGQRQRNATMTPTLGVPGTDWNRRNRAASIATVSGGTGGPGSPARSGYLAVEPRTRRATGVPGPGEWDAGDFLSSKRARMPSTLNITTESTRSASRSEWYNAGAQLPSLVANAETEETRFSMPQVVTEVRNLLLECLVDIVCREPGNNPYAEHFVQMITARWVLLFMEGKINSHTVVLGTRLMAKLLTSQGSAFVERFRSSSQGFVIMANLLPRHWNLLEVHISMLALAFGVDQSEIRPRLPFDLSTLASLLKPDATRAAVMVPEGLTLALTMLKEMVYVMSRQRSYANARFGGWSGAGSDVDADERMPVMRDYCQLVNIYCQLFERLYSASNDAKALLASADVVEQLLLIIFPVICDAAPIPAEAEMEDMEFDGDHGAAASRRQNTLAIPVSSAPAIASRWQDAAGLGVDDGSRQRTVTIPTAWQSGPTAALHDDQPQVNEEQPAFVPVDPLNAQSDDLAVEAHASMHSNLPTEEPLLRGSSSEMEAVGKGASVETLTRSAVDRLCDFVIYLCVESVIGDYKPLSALENVMKGSPPSTPADQKRFRAFLLAKILQKLQGIIASSRNLVLDTRVQSSLNKLASYVVDKLFQGWFNDHAELAFDVFSAVLEIIEADSRGSKTDSNVQGLFRSLNKAIMFQLNEYKSDKDKLLSLTRKCAYHQKIIFSSQNGDSEFYKCLISRMWKMVAGSDIELRNEAISLWKLLLLQKPAEMASVLKAKGKSNEYATFVEGFSKLLEMDSRPFLAWIADRKGDLGTVFHDAVDTVWESFLVAEVKNAMELDKISASKRLARLKRISKRSSSEKATLAKYNSRTEIWLKDVQENEYLRYRRFAQDALDTQSFVMDEWSTTSGEITREWSLWDPALYAYETPMVTWQLDLVEGPQRMRRKLRRSRQASDLEVMQMDMAKRVASPSPLEQASRRSGGSGRLLAGPQSSAALDLLADEGKLGGDAGAEDDLKQEEAAADLVAGNTSAEGAEGEVDDDDEEDGSLMDEDKNRKVARLLEAGDTVLESYNAARVMGLDICEGLLLVCKQNIYLIDNYTRRSDGELDDIDNVPIDERNPYNVILSYSATPRVPGRSRHTCRKWAYDNIKEVHRRKFLFRNVGLEIFLLDGRSFLVTLEPADRDIVYNKLMSRASVAAANRTDSLGSADDWSVGSKLTNIFFAASSLAELTTKWEKWEISNFEYLMRLNTLAGRSYNDLTQFPVFPWVIADYASESLDLSLRSSFRDLSKPMGAQTEERAAEFEDRFRSWEDPDGRPAFHYGTHYSSSMIVCSFLIRLEPFTQLFLKLQGGHLDHADRLFHSIHHAWLSASKLNTTDVRELMPEFYCNPEFLKNSNRYDFGVRQSGEQIDDVVLPPWAKGDPRFFVFKLRQALESTYVSQHLHEWIDLIFGYKQQGQDAVMGLNVFHHLSYEGAVDMDAILDPVEKQATIGIIHNFGQTPRQLFKKPHPPRLIFPPVVFYKLAKQPQLLFPAQKVVLKTEQPVKSLAILNDKVVAFGPGRAKVPNPPGQAAIGTRYLEWGYVDGSARIYQMETDRLVGVFEGLHTGQLTCAQFADDKTLVIGGADTVVTVWRVRQSKQVELTLLYVMRGHRSAIACVAVSRPYNLIVTGAIEDCFALVWDLNRLTYVRHLQHPEPITLAIVNDTTGDIALCSDLNISVYTVNGELLAAREVAVLSADALQSCVFFTGDGWADADLIVTGHRSGVLKLWKMNLAGPRKSEEDFSPRWKLDLVHTLSPKVDPRACTALYLSSSQRFLLSGDSVGRVHAWLMPDGSGTELHFQSLNDASNCASCGRSIGGMTLLGDKRVNCVACGIVYCSECVTPLPTLPGRYCMGCAERAQKYRAEL
ncbi:hypothetical protein DFJ74DRAFT_495541 [Hyaloraphidium curvatum]|nr:hypothetical protein DFJ74DRAFT_495541 [Hyaloraphidium curvatum]